MPTTIYPPARVVGAFAEAAALNGYHRSSIGDAWRSAPTFSPTDSLTLTWNDQQRRWQILRYEWHVGQQEFASLIGPSATRPN